MRLGLDRLKKTGEITVWSNRHMTVITINEYDQYQSDAGSQKADQGQTEDKPRADRGQTEGRQRATMKEREESKESKKAKNISASRAKRAKPTVEEIAAYCRERQNTVDAQRFFDYYEANGWMVGKNAMKDWKAAVRNWERREAGKPVTPQNQPAQLSDWEREQMERVKAHRKATGHG